MAEVPPHLLERSRARRGALGLAPGDEPGAATPVSTAPATTSSTPAAGEAATPATPAPAAPRAAKKGAGAPPTPKAPAEPPSPRIPNWMLPVLVLLPVWALAYVGMFTVQKSSFKTQAEIGASVFSGNCATCHGGNGAGSDAGAVGRPLWKGNSVLTFPKIEEQIAYVRNGSCAKDVPYGNPNRPGGQRKALTGMPAWTNLTEAEITAVVIYERTVLDNKAFPVVDPAAPVTTLAVIDPKTACGTA